ncbi:hypothetical protein K1719_041580 [Acacia pycnantha]|nr:hypothetical protein K1719_041580 [Acacia pycnantha]
MVELTNREGNEGIDSRVPIMNQILEELRNPGVNMIGLWGLGGVGKTTIAKEVAKNQTIFEKMDNLPALTGDFSIKDRATKNASKKTFKSLFNKVLLPKLEILKLSNLNSLIPSIWDDQLLHSSFNNLKTLTVKKCGFVKLVPLHVLKSLNNLEELDVNDCDMLEIVFDFEDLNDYYKEMDSSS